MVKRDRGVSAPRALRPGLSALFFPLWLVLILTACGTPGSRTGDLRPDRKPDPPAPPTGCASGVRPVGVLAVISDLVRLNGRRAINGERVCDGDVITTNATGVGIVLPDNDRESDSLHIAESTDPRFTWTRGGCLSIDSYSQGRVIATARRHCMVVRTPDTLMLLTSGRVQFQVARGVSTRVVPVRGAYTKLQPLSPEQVRALSVRELNQQAAPQAQQPQVHSLNEYRANVLVRPAVKLPPAEIRRIDEMKYIDVIR